MLSISPTSGQVLRTSSIWNGSICPHMYKAKKQTCVEVRVPQGSPSQKGESEVQFALRQATALVPGRHRIMKKCAAHSLHP